MPPRRASFLIGSATVRAGSKQATEFPIAKQVTGSPISLPVLVVHGAFEGPTMWISAAVHGDEINGVEIIRRLIGHIDPKKLTGTLLLVPVVNVPGFTTGNRYLPDRRDLNRSFPGSKRGSLASRIATLFMSEIVDRCSLGIDLHTGSDHRTNLPQIRADLADPKTLELATAFAAPVLMHASIRDGSLRQAGTEAGATVLLFEGGEAWRFDEHTIRVGTQGILNVLSHTGAYDLPRSQPETLLTCRGSSWVRARRGGIAQISVNTGDQVTKGQTIGLIHDAFGRQLSRINAPADGVVVGLSLDPLVNQGDALVHVGEIETIITAAGQPPQQTTGEPV
ncbi:MAG: putative deacylase [Acidimicrobiales bacterium]|jgi:uncharacterized protein